MKQKIFMMLAMVMIGMTASAEAGYTLSVGTSEHGKIAFKVNDQTVTTAEAGQTVTVVITPDDGYAASAITAKAVAGWGEAKAPRRTGIGVLNNIEAKKVKTNEYTLVMPTANVEVSAEYEFSAPVVSEEDKENGKQVDGVTLDMDIVPGTTPEVVDGVTIVQVVITGIDVPKQNDATASDKKELTVEIPAVLTSANGKMKFVVTKITKDALKTPEESNTVVTKVVLPETDEPIVIEEGAMSPNGYPINMVVALSQLDDYSLMTTVKPNFEASKISAIATPNNKFWTFSSGVDCVLPKGISAHIAYLDNSVPRYVEIPESDLQLKDGRRGIKANNGVLLACDNGKGGDAYEVVASPGNQQSGTTPATTNAMSYTGNELVPTIVATHFAAGECLVLKDKKFHTIKSNASKVKPCKAVLPVK